MTDTTAADATSSGPPPSDAHGVLSHRQIMVVLSGLLLGMFLAALDQTIVATAMRTIADRLNGQTAQAWATTAYLITSTVSTPLYGKLSDLYGRKRFYLGAITIFVVGSMLCGTAHSIYQLAIYRGLQGIGAGGLMSLAFAIVGDIVPPRERGRYQAYFMAVFGSSSVLGPVLGGFLAGQATIFGIAGWRYIFYINVPVGLGALFVVFRSLNLPHHRSDHRIDWIGAALLTFGVVPLLVVAEKGREWGWGSATSLSCIIGGAVLLVLFVLWEVRMGDEAILPMRFFHNSIFTVTGTMNFLVGLGMFGGLASLPLYLQIVRGETPTRAGLLMIPLVLGIMTASGVSGQLMSRTGRYKIFPILGTAFMAIAMVLFFQLTATTPLWIACLMMVVMGAGLGLSMQTLVVAVQNAMPPRDMGVVTSAATFFRSMGGTFGTAIFLSILFSSVGPKIKARFSHLQATDPGALKQAMGQLTPTQLHALQAAGGSGKSTALNDTAFIGHLPAVIKSVFLNGFVDSMHLVFISAAVLMVPAVILAWFVKEIPLRKQGGLAAAHAEKAHGVEAAAEIAGDNAKHETAIL